MPIYLLLAATVIFACVALNKLTNRLGIPTLLAFIILGMLFGSDGILKIPFDDYAFAEQICSLALIFIMFYGGFGTSWREARPVAARAGLLSTLGILVTAGAVGLFCRYVLRFAWLESFLLGAVVSSTDAASVFSILRSRRLNLKYRTASLLEIESGSNDPFAYMLTVVILTLMRGDATRGGIAYMIFAQLVYGAGFGVLISVISRWLLRRTRLSLSGYEAIFVLGVAIVSYAAPAALGGNGYLSTYIVGIVLGNTPLRSKKPMVHFFDALTGLMQMLLFFLLGLVSFPSRLPAVLLPSLLIAVFLTFIARPFAVFGLLLPFKSRPRQLLCVSWAGLRGAASIVFAIMATMGATTEHDIFHIVFCVVLFSILVQGTLIPAVSRRLGMIDEHGDVMKTFSDYSEEAPVQFIRFTVTAGHPWSGSAVRDILLPPDTILALLRRGAEQIVPNGNTVLEPGDVLILCARSVEDGIEGVGLYERRILEEDDHVGRTLADIPNAAGDLVVMIQRAGQVVIPRGDTVLEAGDVLVISHPE